MAEYICTICGYEGPGRRIKRGSGKTELIIWIALLIPGPFYSLWRRIGIRRQCLNCGVPTLVNVKSDEGWMARRKVDIELGVIKVEKKAEAPAKEEKPPVRAFGNEKPTQVNTVKKPVDPDQF
jgi:hypothetical protein